jgi:hypothetical protein
MTVYGMSALTVYGMSVQPCVNDVRNDSVHRCTFRTSFIKSFRCETSTVYKCRVLEKHIYFLFYNVYIFSKLFFYPLVEGEVFLGPPTFVHRSFRTPFPPL